MPRAHGNRRDLNGCFRSPRNPFVVSLSNHEARPSTGSGRKGDIAGWCLCKPPRGAGTIARDPYLEFNGDCRNLNRSEFAGSTTVVLSPKNMA